MNVNVNGTECQVVFRQYPNGRPAIQLIDVTDGGPYTTATINLPEVRLGKDEVIIKDYSENAGVLEGLVNSGIVQLTGRSVESGYITAPICKLLVAA